jgi:hypothetical protein
MATKTTAVVLRGVLTADGKLELEGQPDLPPGRVRVTLEPVPAPGPQPSLAEALDEIHRTLEASGYRPRSREEVDADLRALREEWAKREARLERLREGGDAAQGTTRQGEGP